jgi:hypothetical protein
MDDEEYNWYYGSTCHSVGINGGCGYDCPVYQRGDCEEPPEPYQLVCLDATGASLTVGKGYDRLDKKDGFVTVKNDDGEKQEFFGSRFELEEVAEMQV